MIIQLLSQSLCVGSVFVRFKSHQALRHFPAASRVVVNKRCLDGILCENRAVDLSCRKSVESIYHGFVCEFERFIKPGDLQIMDAIRDAGGYVFLHICKDHLGMERYRDYADHFDVVNWGVYEVPFSLEAGRELWPGKTILGGLANRTGAITESAEAVIAEAQKVVDEFDRKGIIIGADCTIATDQDRSIIKALSDACRKM